MKRPTHLFWALAATVLAADQGTKAWVSATLAPGEYVAILGRVVGIRVSANTGAAFGLLASAGPALTLLTLAGVAALLLYTRHVSRAHPFALPALGLLLGGALGNLADRVRLGHVVDFIYTSFWPTFNVADIALTAGAILLSLGLLGASHRSAARDGEKAARQP
ncbi:MAG: signal peptidase II [Armatimonadota bacterium]|nr:signal peptidase II [Armatimonadota bacterium]